MRSAVKRYSNILIIISFVGLSFLSVMLLMATHSLNGNSDLPMHLQQLKEVQLAIQHHTLIYYGLNQFHGSAIMTLYPWLNLWPAGLLAIFVKSKILVIYLFFMFYEFVGLMISYFSSLSQSHSKRVSYLFAIFYGLSTLYLDYGFADSDYGELLTMTFLPLVIFGAIALFQHADWLELSAGMTLIIGSHVLNTLFVLGLLIIFFFLNLFKLRKKLLINLVKAVGLTTFTTIAIWLPALLLLHFNPQITTPPSYPLYGTPFKQIVTGALNGGITYGVSLFALSGVLLGALGFFTLNRYVKQLYVISTLLVIICSAWFKWWYLLPKSFMQLQFTWRLYIIPEVCLSYVAAKVIIHVTKRFPTINWLIFTGLILIALGVQFESQQQMINLNGHAPIFSRQYSIKHSQRCGYKGRYIQTRLGTHPHSTIKTPENFRLKGNRSYNEVFDQKHFLKSDNHYWPMMAANYFNAFNDHVVRSRQGLTGGFYTNGYDRYTFTNRKPVTDVFLPIIAYNGEHLLITMDGHRIPSKVRQNTLFMRRLPKGTHQLTVNQNKGELYYLSVISLVIGLLIYVIDLIFKLSKALRKPLV